MGGCSAPFCNNSAAEGYIMKAFPSDPIRRASWAQNIPDENWVPTNDSFLCEVHFAPEMWEANCKHKLKEDAIPTIFGFYVKKQVMSQGETKDVKNKETTDNIENEETTDIENEEAIENIENEETIENIGNEISRSDTSKLTTLSASEAVDDSRNEKVIINDTSELITLVTNEETNDDIRNEKVIINDTSELITLLTNEVTTESENKEDNIIETFVINYTSEPPILLANEEPPDDGGNEVKVIETIVINFTDATSNEDITDNVGNNEVNETSELATPPVNETSELATPPVKSMSQYLFEFYENKAQENEKYKGVAKKQKLQLITLTKKIKALRYIIGKLQSEIDNDRYKKALNRILNEDQIEALLKKDHDRNWSDETIQRALKLKLACGVNGYEEILRHGIPLPCLRTLRRKMGEEI